MNPWMVITYSNCSWTLARPNSAHVKCWKCWVLPRCRTGFAFTCWAWMVGCALSNFVWSAASAIPTNYLAWIPSRTWQIYLSFPGLSCVVVWVPKNSLKSSLSLKWWWQRITQHLPWTWPLCRRWTSAMGLAEGCDPRCSGGRSLDSPPANALWIVRVSHFEHLP